MQRIDKFLFSKSIINHVYDLCNRTIIILGQHYKLDKIKAYLISVSCSWCLQGVGHNKHARKFSNVEQIIVWWCLWCCRHYSVTNILVWGLWNQCNNTLTRYIYITVFEMINVRLCIRNMWIISCSVCFSHINEFATSSGILKGWVTMFILKTSSPVLCIR